MTSENIIETVGLCYRYAGNDRDSLSEVRASGSGRA